MKHYGTVARSLIALLFVVAGYQKLTTFAMTAGFIGSLGVPAPTLATALVIFVEIVVALAFAFGYKVKETGYILMGFVALTILIAHRDWSQPANVMASLKNLSIIGGLMLAVCCRGKHHG
jgi:putative oxidoreductase